MKDWRGWFVLLLPLLAACTSSNPYLVTTENCFCEEFTYRDERANFTVEVKATYEVHERVTSVVELKFGNGGKDTLDLRQGFIKGTAKNVRYQFNDRFQPLPHVVVPPGTSYTMVMQGSDTELVAEPWHKIAGEQVTIELRGIQMGSKPVNPVVITMIPRNPKFGT
ncbi:MAG: hypothetical protein WEB62_09970 [Bacteroidota bacterium]